jgi:3-oxoacyl-[acyl-carrier-protein] synthase III
MGVFQIPAVRLAAVAATVPTQEVRNSVGAPPDGSAAAQFARRVGITTRRVAPPSLCASDLCIRAATEILDGLQVPRDTIGALAFVTQTPDYPLPGNSTLVQRELGLPTTTCLLDVNQGCAGYVYGLAILASMMSVGGIGRGLLLVGDTITRLLSAEDRSTVPLFSDAGSATLLERSPAAAPMWFDLGGDGAGAAAIQVRGGGSRQPFGPDSLVLHGTDPGVRRADVHLAMRGLDVLHYVLTHVEPSIRALLTSANGHLTTPDYYVFHQANRVLNTSLASKLGIDERQAPETLSEYGNTSCASIPITMCRRLSARLSGAATTLLLSGFGSGFSWGSALIRTDALFCTDVLEVDAAEVHVC